MKSGAVLLVLTLAAASHAAMTTLDFENLAHTTLLGAQYASLGATFTSTDTAAAKRGGSGFNFTNYPPRSSDTLIVSKFNGLIDVSFSHDVSDVSVWVLSPQTFGAKLTAYGAAGPWGASLATATNPTNPAYRQLTVHATGIRSITIQAPAGFSVIDDLSFTAAPVPEPASLAALGLGALGVLRKCRRGTRSV